MSVWSRLKQEVLDNSGGLFKPIVEQERRARFVLFMYAVNWAWLAYAEWLSQSFSWLSFFLNLVLIAGFYHAHPMWKSRNRLRFFWTLYRQRRTLEWGYNDSEVMFMTYVQSGEATWLLMQNIHTRELSDFDTQTGEPVPMPAGACVASNLLYLLLPFGDLMLDNAKTELAEMIADRDALRERLENRHLTMTRRRKLALLREDEEPQ